MDCKFTTDLGLVTVNDDVLVRVAGYAALDCYGIVGMASKRSTDGIVQLMGKENLGRGVKIRTSGDKVDIDLFIIVEYGISIRAEVQRVKRVQKRIVKTAVQSAIFMPFLFLVIFCLLFVKIRLLVGQNIRLNLRRRR